MKHPLVRGCVGPPQDHAIDFRTFLNLARRRALGSPRLLVQLEELSSRKVPEKDTFERLPNVHYISNKENALYQAQHSHGGRCRFPVFEGSLSTLLCRKGLGRPPVPRERFRPFCPSATVARTTGACQRGKATALGSTPQTGLPLHPMYTGQTVQ